MPAAMKLLAVKFEAEMTLLIAFVRVVFRNPFAAIPDHHGAAAVLSFRDDPFELIVFLGMIFDVNREPLFVGYQTGSFGDGPALHHTVEFKPQIVVQPSRGMLLDHELFAAAACHFASARFRRDRKLPLLAVDLQSHISSRASSVSASFPALVFLPLAIARGVAPWRAIECRARI